MKETFNKLADVAMIIFFAAIFVGFIGRTIITTINELRNLWNKREE